MDFWFIIIVTLCIATLLKSTLGFFSRRKSLPPGPPGLPLIGNLMLLRKPITELGHILSGLKAQYGPLLTVRIGKLPFIFIGSHSLAHRALVQNGEAFADRPDPTPTMRIMNPTMISITASPYGPTWRHLRRNLTQEILSVRRVRAYSASRRWVLSLLINRLADQPESTPTAQVPVIDHFQYAMFCLLAFMCFGDGLQESQIQEIKETERAMFIGLQRFYWLNLWPRLSRLIFRNQWNELIRLFDNHQRVMIPLVRARVQAKETGADDQILAYADTLLDLELPKENRKLRDDEIVCLCSELLLAGTDTTAITLQWIMANLVKHPEYQEKVYQEITGAIGTAPPVRTGDVGIEKVVEEKDLEKMPYLKAVVLEGLRRYPPAHLGLPHKVKEDVELDGYTIPKNAVVSFMLADMGCDPKVWDDPMEFKPERFITGGGGEAFDVTGSREFKMMPFGVGRRICPGLALSLLHLEYFVANLVWYFEWRALEGEEIDMSEKVQITTTVMKNPLRARISPRA